MELLKYIDRINWIFFVLATMISLDCHHNTSNCSSHTNDAPTIIFPNFIRINKCNVYTHDSLHYGDYVYLGGDIGIERGFIENYTAQIIHHDLSMIGTAATMNQEAINHGYPQLAPVDRRLLTNIIHAYLVIQLDLSMGSTSVSTPCSLADFDQWAWEQFPRLLSYFIYLWTNHRTLVGSCGAHCSKCLIIDGHQKSRRRICAFKDVTVETEEMKDLVIGCCQTPIRWSRYCRIHKNLSTITEHKQSQSSAHKKRQMKKFFHPLSNISHRKKDRLNATSCRTIKARSDSYVKKCTRSFGIIALVSNCRIITSFSELYRSETLREIINLFAVAIRDIKLNFECNCLLKKYFFFYCLVAGQLAPTCVYDDGCHLVRYVKNHIGQELVKTPAMELLDSTPISVDRSHFRNHVGTFCRRTMNPDKNPCSYCPISHLSNQFNFLRLVLDNVNTEAAEQTFSWLKQYAQIISNMNHLRTPLFMLTLFHLKNLSRVKRPPSFIFDVVRLYRKLTNSIFYI